MAQLIDANKYPCYKCETYGCGTVCDKLKEWLTSTVDAVEVVQCKNCKHWEKGNAKSFLGFGTCWKCMLKTHQDHFCSYGERREDDGRKGA